MGKMIFGWIVKKAGLSAIGASGGSFLLLAALAISLGSAWGGYKFANTIWEAKQLQTVTHFAEAIKEIDNLHRVRERELIEKSKQRRVVVKEVIKHVPTYVDRDKCALTPAGVQSVADAARSAFTGTQRNSDGSR